jgi:hypothetical protein
MPLHRIIAIAAVLALLAGIYGLFAPIEVVTDAGRADCGTAVAPDYAAGYRVECDNERGDRNLWAIPLTVIGLLGLAVIGVMKRSAKGKAAQ